MDPVRPERQHGLLLRDGSESQHHDGRLVVVVVCVEAIPSRAVHAEVDEAVRRYARREARHLRRPVGQQPQGVQHRQEQDSDVGRETLRADHLPRPRLQRLSSHHQRLQGHDVGGLGGGNALWDFQRRLTETNPGIIA